MPPLGVSVPRSKVHRGDRWSDDLELEIPARRARSERRTTSRATPPPQPTLHDDPYDLHLDLHVEFGLTPPVSRAASRPAPARASAASRPAPARASAASRPASRRASAAPERRTVTIQGRPSDQYRPATDSRRRQPPPHHRAGFQPDRVAMWAVFLGLVLVLVAATSSHAAVLSAHALATLTAR